MKVNKFSTFSNLKLPLLIHPLNKEFVEKSQREQSKEIGKYYMLAFQGKELTTKKQGLIVL